MNLVPAFGRSQVRMGPSSVREWQKLGSLNRSDRDELEALQTELRRLRSATAALEPQIQDASRRADAGELRLKDAQVAGRRVRQQNRALASELRSQSWQENRLKVLAAASICSFVAICYAGPPSLVLIAVGVLWVWPLYWVIRQWV